MKILMTGSGFLAKEFSSEFGDSCIIKANRRNLTDLDYLKDIVKDNAIDHIIHTSWAGVGAGTIDDYNWNIQVDDNMHKISDKVSKVFTFGSGIEFMSPRNCGMPLYQKAKAIVALNARYNERVINLRLFGCFGKNENYTRFIKQSVRRLKVGRPVQISKRRDIDFFYSKDLVRVIEHYMNSSEDLPGEVDCVYSTNTLNTLTSIADHLVISYSEPFDSIKYVNEGYVKYLSDEWDEPYTGEGAILNSLGIELVGIEKGIEEIYGT